MTQRALSGRLIESLEARSLLSAVYPSATEQYLVEVINRARANPLAEAARYGINLNEGLPAGTISSSWKQPLAINPYLTDSARRQSAYQSSINSLSHYGPGGAFLDTRFAAAGYTWVWPYAGYENVAWDAPRDFTTVEGPDGIQKILFVDTVVSSRGHRTTLMNGTLEEIGVGLVRGPMQGYDAMVATEEFAYTKGGQTFLTGVAYNDYTHDNFYTPGEGLGGVTITATRLSDNATYTTSTWGSGGYTINIAPGTYRVVASGGGLNGTVTINNVTIGNDNVKLDFTPAMVNGTVVPPVIPPVTTTQSPFSGTPVNIAASGTTTIEAENFDNGGDGVSYHDVDSANNGGAYRNTGVDIQSCPEGGYNVGWTKAGEWMEYTVNVAASGPATLAFRMSNAGSGGTFHMEVDGVNVTGSLAAPSTGSWGAYTDVIKSGVSLSAGQHVLRLVMDSLGSSGNVANINSMKITTAAATQGAYIGAPVTVSSAAAAMFQVENFDNGGEGVSYHDTDPTNNGGAYRATGVDLQNTSDAGGGYSLGWTKAGEWLEYTANVTTAGAYNLEFRVASNGAGGTFHLEVDGANVTGAMSAPNTGGWQTWATISKSINLSAGAHVLRLAMDTVGGTGNVGNFNWFRLTSSSTNTGGGTTPTGQTPFSGTPVALASTGSTTIEAENFDNGGEGVAFHDTDTTNNGGAYRNTGVDIQNCSEGGHNIGWTRAGEWLEYTVNVVTAGNYNLDLRVANTAAGATMHAEVDGANVTGAMSVPVSGSWSTWQTMSKTGISLSAGTHVIRIAMDSAATNGYVANLNWIRFTRA